MLWISRPGAYHGFLPEFFRSDDPRPAREQLHTAYAHGGGVHPFSGFTLHNWQEPLRAELHYPGDPPTREFGRTKLRDETIIHFEHDWVAIVQPDGSFLCCRVD